MQSISRYHRVNSASIALNMIRSLSTASSLFQAGGVHGSKYGAATKMWRNKPLFVRGGKELNFKTGAEAANLLIQEAQLKDPGSEEFLASWEAVVNSLTVVFDRTPKFAWVMKLLLEPERSITFRVAWIDDHGNTQLNRGFRVQYSSALGPYQGGLSFGSHVNHSYVKAAAFDNVFRNALSRKGLGGAFGGADFDPYTKSDTEIQRFCQSFMTELSKYIGQEVDYPGLGEGVSPVEIGYLYGQYKRITQHYGQVGTGLLWGGAPVHTGAVGTGVADFAKLLLRDKGMSIEGKRCLITGTGHVAISLAERLVELGAIPITFSDSAGHIYEPGGFDAGKLKTVVMIQHERGARIGRYIMASTTAKFADDNNELFNIPCDIVFPCTTSPLMNAAAIDKLAANGCKAVVEGAKQGLSNEGFAAAKKRGLVVGPHRATLIGSALISGSAYDRPITAAMEELYEELKSTAKEFNTRGDISAAANIAAFHRVADVMIQHGTV